MLQAVRWIGRAAVVAVTVLSSQAAFAQGTHRYTVSLRDYAFIAPDTVEAGRNEFVSVNDSDHPHEFFIVKLQADVDTRVAFDSLRVGGFGAFLRASGSVSPVAAIWGRVPRTGAPGSMTIAMQPGERYVFLCTLRDNPQAARHDILGMVKLVHVR